MIAPVGTPEQDAESPLDAHDLGVRPFPGRDFDPLEDAIQYGRDLRPAFKALPLGRTALPTAGRRPVPRRPCASATGAAMPALMKAASVRDGPTDRLAWSEFPVAARLSAGV